MEFIARFEKIDGVLFRFDTRIYLNSYDSSIDSTCIGAIIGKNPGSAKPKMLDELVPLELNGDKMLPTVKNRFLDAYKLAKKNIPLNAFVRVWNLFYICNPDLDAACRIAAKMKILPNCSTENKETPIVWYGWGDGAKLNEFKKRFMQRTFQNEFYYDHNRSCISVGSPSLDSFAKHTQGLPSKPVNEYLASVV